MVSVKRQPPMYDLELTREELSTVERALKDFMERLYVDKPVPEGSISLGILSAIKEAW